jgi:hypothetical protein
MILRLFRYEIKKIAFRSGIKLILFKNMFYHQGYMILGSNPYLNGVN